MKQVLRIKGLWVPLVTPFYQGQLDVESTIKLVKEIEPHVDGFVPCLSSGEGANLNDELWEKVITVVTENTEKPVIAGVLRDSLENIIVLSEKAKKLGCVAIAVPLQGKDTEDQKKFCRELSDMNILPIVLYNTEKIHIDNLDVMVEISKYDNILAIKDSSTNQKFFDEMVRYKKEGKISISVLQGMENQLLESSGCDGYLISLANVEPKLCKEMLDHPSTELNDQIMAKWDEFNLGSEKWYVGIKEALASRGIIRSAELI